jgi:hypothetical protein
VFAASRLVDRNWLGAQMIEISCSSLTELLTGGVGQQSLQSILREANPGS